jgi:hypothetical protein
MKKTTFLVTLGLTIALGLAIPQRSLAQNVGSSTNDDLPQTYGAFSITNNTNVTIRYKRQWGNEGWREIILRPGFTETHSHKLDRNDRAPSPHVQFYSSVANRLQLHGGLRNAHVHFSLVTTGGYGPSADSGRPYSYQFVLSADGHTLHLRPGP